MITIRVLSLAAFAVLFQPANHASTLSISITGASSTMPSFRVVANAGDLRSGGAAYRVAGDTLSLHADADLSTTEPVFAGTFIAEAPTSRISVVVREKGNVVAAGQGEAIIVIRTPLGAQLQAMTATALTQAP